MLLAGACCMVLQAAGIHKTVKAKRLASPPMLTAQRHYGTTEDKS